MLERSSVDSLQELDSELRVLSALVGDMPAPDGTPLLLSSGTKAAFPRVSQRWLAGSLSAVGRGEVERFAASLYDASDALYSITGVIGPSSGLLRACADDVAASCASIFLPPRVGRPGH